MSASQTVLIADDEPSVLALASAVLTRAGYRVLTAHNGSEGLAVFEKAPDRIDLLLTDVQMPVVDGISLAKSAKSVKSDLKVLVMSGYVPDGHIEKDLEELGAGFIQKPFAIKDFEDRVHSLLREGADVRIGQTA